MKTLLDSNIGKIVKIRENDIPTEFIVIQIQWFMMSGFYIISY